MEIGYSIRRQGVDGRVQDRRGCTDASALARTLGTQRIRWRSMLDPLRSQVERGAGSWNDLVCEPSRQRLTGLVVVHLLAQRRSDTLHERSMELTLDCFVVEHGADVIYGD